MYLPQQAKVMIHRDNHKHCLSLLNVLPVHRFFHLCIILVLLTDAAFCAGQQCASLEPKREASAADSALARPLASW